jgi:hypothetical protein
VREKVLDDPGTDLHTVQFLDAVDAAVRAAFAVPPAAPAPAAAGGRVIPLPPSRRLQRAG